ncbi:MAG: hypothetical protein PWR12_1646, partial [Eubacteriaceae bacterium]|nr:hypothetical protein [Eubacteriaceae bacterium]
MPIISDFKLGNCTNPRADYEIQLVGAGFVYTLKASIEALEKRERIGFI